MAYATRLGLFAALTLAIVLPTAAHASLPVPFAYTGCVADGAFTIDDRGRAALTHPALRALAGNTVRIEGMLSPGDRFHTSGVFVVDEVCRNELHGHRFLCAPCATLPGQPEELLPPQPGVRIDLPEPALRELDDLSRRLRR